METNKSNTQATLVSEEKNEPRLRLNEEWMDRADQQLPIFCDYFGKNMKTRDRVEQRGDKM